MDHNSIRHKLSEYIDGTISADEKAEIETHLAACEKCSDALRELRKTVEHVRTIEEIEPPAWMTQKIMAKVRAEAEQRKSIFQRLYSAFVVNLPVKAVAVVFLAAIAFYMYRDIRPQKLSEAPMPQAAVKKEAPLSGIAKSEQNRAKDFLLRSNQVPQKPGYKALDMKPEYEKPAPPALQDKAAASAPAAAKPFAAPEPAREAKEGQSNILSQKSRASVGKEGASAPAMDFMAEGDQRSKGMARAAKTKAVLREENGTYAAEITVSVKDLDAAQKEVEKAATASGGKIIRTALPAVKNQIIVSITTDKFSDFLAKLKTIGDVKENAPAPTDREGYLTIRITMTKN